LRDDRLLSGGFVANPTGLFFLYIKMTYSVNDYFGGSQKSPLATVPPG
jgi:hypothetical protein